MAVRRQQKMPNLVRNHTAEQAVEVAVVPRGHIRNAVSQDVGTSRGASRPAEHVGGDGVQL